MSIQPLTNGGMATVLVGHTGFVQEFANHPRVRFINCKEVDGSNLENLFPNNTQIVIITEGVPAYHYTWSTSFARRKNVPFITRKSMQAVYDALRELFPAEAEKKPTIEEVKEDLSRGKLNLLIPSIDWNKSNAENARDLLRIATEKGIKTTLGSLSQLVSMQRKKQNRGDIPRSARSQLDVSVEMLDKMIEDLGSMRDYLISVTEENRMIKQKLERFKKAFEE